MLLGKFGGLDGVLEERLQKDWSGWKQLPSWIAMERAGPACVDLAFTGCSNGPVNGG